MVLCTQTGILNGTHNGTHNLTHVSNNSTLNSSMDNIPHIPIGTAHGFLSMDKKRSGVASVVETNQCTLSFNVH